MSEPVSAAQDSRPDYLRADVVSNTRALILYSTGIVIGLILGGISLFNARGTTTNQVPDEVLALVNQRPVLRSDFIIQLEAETGMTFDETSREEQMRVLDEMVREELFVQRGLELDFAETDQNTRYALYDIVEQQILADVLIGGPSDEELQTFYTAHQAEFLSRGQFTLRHLVQHAGDAAAATAAAQALREGMPLEEAKQRYGLAEADFYPGDFYYSAEVHLGEELFALAQTLDSGQTSEPLLRDDGYHLLQMLQHQPPVPLSFEQARTDVQTRYYNSEKARVMNNMLTFLRNRSTILIADDYAQDYRPEDFADTY